MEQTCVRSSFLFPPKTLTWTNSTDTSQAWTSEKSCGENEKHQLTRGTGVCYAMTGLNTFRVWETHVWKSFKHTAVEILEYLYYQEEYRRINVHHA